MSPAGRARLGISEGLLRISAGIEEVEDIIADIGQAFGKHSKTMTAEANR
jgi:cystathionine beta-lyase/cystathionine gamma-synthase